MAGHCAAPCEQLLHHSPLWLDKMPDVDLHLLQTSSSYLLSCHASAACKTYHTQIQIISPSLSTLKTIASSPHLFSLSNLWTNSPWHTDTLLPANLLIYVCHFTEVTLENVVCCCSLTRPHSIYVIGVRGSSRKERRLWPQWDGTDWANRVCVCPATQFELYSINNTKQPFSYYYNSTCYYCYPSAPLIYFTFQSTR